MGMAASQARLLAITARISDSELRAQNVQNTKIRLSTESEEISKQYLQSLSAKVMKISTFNQSTGKMCYEDLTYDLLTENSMRLVKKDANGNTVALTKDEIAALKGNKDYMQYQMYAGNLFLQKFKQGDDGNMKWEDESWQSGNNGITEFADDSEADIIKAKYDTDMAKIQTKEKKLDLELKNIDTEHSALQTEYESVKKVIDKNIETSFKMFS